jgi:8-oxo-dGTP pyrophosphatase MutT (NUDIX family)
VTGPGLDADRSLYAADPVRSGAAALLHTRDGRYLMQHREKRPEVSFADCLCCFGGGIEPGESPLAALRRELREELAYAPRSARQFTEMTVLLPFPDPRIERLLFFAVPIRESDIAGLRLREGAGMTLFRPRDLAAHPKVVPWDLAAVLMHARRRTLFARRRPPA